MLVVPTELQSYCCSATDAAAAAAAAVVSKSHGHTMVRFDSL